MAGPAGADGPDGHIAELVTRLVRDVPDWPTPGVVFKDISPLLADAAAFAAVVTDVARRAREAGATLVAGIEARGFVLAAPAAVAAGAGFLPVRKAGKLPGRTLRRDYALEYGTASVELQPEVVRPGQRVLLVDDVLATGGTAQAACELLTEAGAQLVGLHVLLELSFLGGRGRLGVVPVTTSAVA
ncbi:adenine phosphoribosyltransferase [Kineococcus xinjiangensis]|uniref:adenine phosphoribosyltransferase n=1 Tax=Kineococcus xinjiangensis TaxID=512762 RepID=UPI000CEC99C1